MNDITNPQDAIADERPIPRPPGGGSWTFDRSTWQWASNDPKPEPENEPAQAVKTDAVEQPAQVNGDDIQQPQGSQE